MSFGGESRNLRWIRTNDDNNRVLCVASYVREGQFFEKSIVEFPRCPWLEYIDFYNGHPFHSVESQ